MNLFHKITLEGLLLKFYNRKGLILHARAVQSFIKRYFVDRPSLFGPYD